MPYSYDLYSCGPSWPTGVRRRHAPADEHLDAVRAHDGHYEEAEEEVEHLPEYCFGFFAPGDGKQAVFGQGHHELDLCLEIG